MNLLHINRQYIKWCVKSEVHRLFDKQRKYLNQAKNAKKTSLLLTTQNQKNLENKKKNSEVHSDVKNNEIVNEPITVEKILKKMIKTENYSDSEIGNLVMAEDSDNELNLMPFSSSEIKTTIEDNIQKKSLSNEEVGSNDLLGDILSSMGLSSTEQNNKGLFFLFKFKINFFFV